MRLRFPLLLLAVLAIVQLWPHSDAPAPRPTSAAPDVKSGPIAAKPGPTTPARPPTRDVIVKQGQTPAATQPLPALPADISRTNGFLPVPFRSSPAGGAVQNNAPLRGKVDGAIGQRIDKLPPGIKMNPNPRRVR